MIKMTNFETFALVFCCVTASVSGYEYKVKQVNLAEERRLIKDIWKDYDTRARPTLDPSETLDVLWETLLVRVLQVDKNCVMTIDVHVDLSWHDDYLSWNPTEFAGIEYLHRPVDEIWRPDISLLNNAGHDKLVLGDRIATINSTGHVRWMPHLRIEALSSTDYTFFPYDTQEFFTTFASWLPETLQTFILIDKDYRVRFMDRNVEWDMKSVHVVAKKINDFVEEYSAIIYLLKMERRPTFYKHFIVSPTAITGILILLLFFFSHRYQQRFIFGAILFLSLLVIIGILQSYLPVGLIKTPIIASIIAYELFILFLVVSTSILTFKIYKRDPRKHKVPSCMRTIFLNKFTKRLFCLSSSLHTPRDSHHPIANRVLGAESTVSYMQLSNEEIHLPSSSSPSSPNLARSESRNDPGDATAKEFINLSKHLDSLLSIRDCEYQSVNEWEQLASILDMVFLFFFSLLSAVVVGKLCNPTHPIN